MNNKKRIIFFIIVIGVLFYFIRIDYVKTDNVFDEMYYSGAVKTTELETMGLKTFGVKVKGYNLLNKSSVAKISCSVRTSGDSVPGMYDGYVSDKLPVECFKEDEQTDSIEIKYLSVLQIVLEVEEISKLSEATFIFEYDSTNKQMHVYFVCTETQSLNCTSLSNFKKSTAVVSPKLYEEFDFDEQNLEEIANLVLFKEFLPKYFQSNNKFWRKSKFNEETLGEFEIIYHF